MPSQRLSVGATVRFTRVDADAPDQMRDYRVEQLIAIETGVTLYKIRNASEPFDRLVSEADLVRF